MAEASLLYVDSPRSDNDDMDHETLTSMFLAKVRAEEAAGGSYGKLTGLASPDYASYTPKADLSTRNVQRYSLISSSSDGSSSPMSSAWRAPAFASPSLKSGASRTPSCPYSISLVDDELSSSLSPLDSALSKNARWAANSPQASSNGTSYSRSALNSWTTISASTPSETSSTDNTQNLSWSSSPFKATPQSTTNKENRLPNISSLSSVASTPKTPASDGLTDRFAQELTNTLTPSLASQSPATAVSPQIPSTSLNLSSISRNNSATKETQSNKGAPKEVASLIDLDASFSAQEPTSANSTDFDTLTHGLNTFTIAGGFPSATSPESGVELDSSLSETTISNLNSFFPPKPVAAPPSEPIIAPSKNRRSSRVSLVPAPSTLVEEDVPKHFEDNNLAEMARVLKSVLCDTAKLSRESWLRPIRPLFTFEDLLALALGPMSSDTNQQALMDDALLEMMETGDVEALDLQEDDETTITRLYRASPEIFALAASNNNTATSH